MEVASLAIIYTQVPIAYIVVILVDLVDLVVKCMFNLMQ